MAFIVSFDHGITEDLLLELPGLKPKSLHVVFRDQWLHRGRGEDQLGTFLVGSSRPPLKPSNLSAD